MMDKSAIFEGKQTERNGEPVSEHSRFVRFRAVRFVEYQDFIAPRLLIEGGRDFLVVICVYRVLQSSHGPHTPSGIPDDGDRFANAFVFASDKLDFESRGQGEGGPLFFRGERG